jgi:hypothetical protein
VAELGLRGAGRGDDLLLVSVLACSVSAARKLAIWHTDWLQWANLSDPARLGCGGRQTVCEQRSGAAQGGGAAGKECW